MPWGHHIFLCSEGIRAFHAIYTPEKLLLPGVVILAHTQQSVMSSSHLAKGVEVIGWACSREAKPTFHLSVLMLIAV